MLFFWFIVYYLSNGELFLDHIVVGVGKGMFWHLDMLDKIYQLSIYTIAKFTGIKQISWGQNQEGTWNPEK